MAKARGKTGILVAVALFSTVLLFASKAVYATYEVSSRVAADKAAKQDFLDNAVFFAQAEGMHQYPGIIDLDELLLNAQTWNSHAPVETSNAVLNFLRTDVPEDFGIQIVDGKFVGIYRQQKPGYSFGVAGCALCHAGKAAGVFVPGLGNKNVNLKKFSFFGLDLPQKASFLFDAPKNSSSQYPEYDQVRAGAERMEKILSDPRYVSPTDGLIENNIVLKTFFEAFGQTYDEGPKHFLNKVPPLWGIEEKRKVGLFYDGAGDGTAPGWNVAPEIMWGQKADVIASDSYLQKIHRTETSLNSFLPPIYPFEINASLAKKGSEVFAHTCVACHGNYERDEHGLPIYEAPKLVPVSVVQTDPLRSELFANDRFWNAAQNSPFQQLIRKGPHYGEKGPAYFAPRLVGIWSRFPYLHNASVPTLWHMLHPDARPEFFSLIDAGERYRFDEKKVGLTTDPHNSLRAEILGQKASLNDSTVYSTFREGQSSEGHLFGADLSEDDKIALLEYLKTL